MYQAQQNDDGVWVLAIAVTVLLVILYRRHRPLSSTACGTAFWMTERLLKAWGFLGQRGLVVGRTFGGALVRVPKYCHVLLVGGPGAGKGVGVIIPNLRSRHRGSRVVFDTKGDLYATCAGWLRERGYRVFNLSPFGDGVGWNVLDTVGDKDPLLTDHAKAMAESLVVRPPGGSRDPHWDDRSAQVIAALLVLVLSKFEGPERSLNAVLEIASDPVALFNAATELQKMGGVPRNMGGGVKGLYDKHGQLTEEGGSVVSTMLRHLDFMNSEAVAASLSSSEFDVKELFKPNTVLFLNIPMSQLEAQRGLLRCWVSTIVLAIGSRGSEDRGEILMILDEASALGSLPALREALVRGRSAGCRILLAYQSDSQISAAFPDQPSLLYDACATQVYLGASSIETADRLSKSIGNWTQAVESRGANWNESLGGGHDAARQVSRGHSSNVAVQGRALLFPDEILRLPDDQMIVFHRGLPAATLCRRIRWFDDPAFNEHVKAPGRGRRWQPRVIAGALAVFAGMLLRAWFYGYGAWAPEQPKYRYVESSPVFQQKSPANKGGSSWRRSVKGR